MLGPTQLVSWGILYYAFSVIMPSMRAEMGWSAAETSGAFSVAMFATGLASVPAGRWLDARGPRLLMTLGSVLATALVVAWAGVQSLPGLYAIWAALGVTMAATLYDPAFWVVARWFRRRRDRALTIVTVWGGLASTAFIPLTTSLVQTQGWRSAVLALAGLLGVLTILPHALMLRRGPEDVGQAVDGGEIEALGARPAAVPLRGVSEALRSRAFILLATAFGLTSLMAAAMSVHLVSYGLSRGLSAETIASAAGTVGVLQVVGRLTFAPLAGRVSRRAVTALMFVLTALAMVSLIALPIGIGLILYVVMYGLGHGALTPLRASLVADTFGSAIYGRMNGALSLVATFARAIAPVAVGLAVTQTGTYSPALAALGLGALLGAGAIVALGERR